jgi:hypothetical protein
VRCGTNFLLILFVVTLILFTVLFSAIGRPPLYVRVPLQILAVPVIVGIAYEGIRLGAGRERSALVKALMKPGLWLQMLTTKPPSPDMIEVAIRSLEQVLPPAERATVGPLPSPLVAGVGAQVDDLAGRPAPDGRRPVPRRRRVLLLTIHGHRAAHEGLRRLLARGEPGGSRQRHRQSRRADLRLSRRVRQLVLPDRRAEGQGDNLDQRRGHRRVAKPSDGRRPLAAALVARRRLASPGPHTDGKPKRRHSPEQLDH